MLGLPSTENYTSNLFVIYQILLSVNYPNWIFSKFRRMRIRDLRGRDKSTRAHRVTVNSDGFSGTYHEPMENTGCA